MRHSRPFSLKNSSASQSVNRKNGGLLRRSAPKHAPLFHLCDDTRREPLGLLCKACTSLIRLGGGLGHTLALSALEREVDLVQLRAALSTTKTVLQRKLQELNLDVCVPG